MKLATFDENGFPTAFYDDGEHATIPELAVGLTEEQWQEFIDNQGLRRWNNDTVEEYVPPAPPLDSLKINGKRIIDENAELTRQRFATKGSLQAMVYQEKSEQAADFVAAGYPSDISNYPFIQAEMDATSKTKEQAADDILTQKSAWIAVGALVEKHRLSGKLQIDNAIDENAVNTVVADTVALLDMV